jgi:catechol 2,3-dioxygenase-like lactoylglutathione lyase family enzyme
MHERRWKIVLPLVLLALPFTATPAETTAKAAEVAGPRVSMIGPALRSTDLDRSIKFYTSGLGMTVVRKIPMGSSTEVILSFGGGPEQPLILLYKDATPGKSPPIEHGNGFGRVVLRVSDATALSAQLVAAGYQVGEAHANSVNHMKVFWVSDPDGYKYEITEVPSKQ